MLGLAFLEKHVYVVALLGLGLLPIYRSLATGLRPLRTIASCLAKRS